MDKLCLDLSPNKNTSVIAGSSEPPCIQYNCEDILQTIHDKQPIYQHKKTYNSQKSSNSLSSDIRKQQSPSKDSSSQHIESVISSSILADDQIKFKTPPLLKLPRKFIDCPICQGKCTEQCFLCHGRQYVEEDNPLIKFFQAILQFKIGAVNQYCRNLRQRCRTVFDKKILSLPSKIKKSQRGRRMTLAQRRNLCQNVHYGYFCNLCGNDQPIIGSRYTCSLCQEYDLCETCYFHNGHKHHMTQIGKSPSFECSMRCLQKPLKTKQQFNCQKKVNQFEKASSLHQFWMISLNFAIK